MFRSGGQTFTTAAYNRKKEEKRKEQPENCGCKCTIPCPHLTAKVVTSLDDDDPTISVISGLEFTWQIAGAKVDITYDSPESAWAEPDNDHIYWRQFETAVAEGKDTEIIFDHVNSDVGIYVLKDVVTFRRYNATGNGSGSINFEVPRSSCLDAFRHVADEIKRIRGK